MFSIIISEKGGVERRETFEQDEVTVGRVQGNDLMLPKGNVSKRHCRLEYSGGRFIVVDQNSTNGTYVNRRRISQATAIREGDRIYVGDFVLRVENAPPAEDAQQADPGGTTGPESVAPPEPDAMGTAIRDSADGHPVPAPVGASIAPGPAFQAPAFQGALASAPLAAPTPGLSAPPPGLPLRAVSAANAEAAPRISAQGLATPEVGAEQLIGAVRFLVERVSGKLEPRALEREVTEELQRRVDRLLEEVYGSLREQSLPAHVSEAAVKAAARAELLELGPLGSLLDDPSVSEISVAGGGSIVVQRGTETSRTELPFCAARSVDRALARLCRQEGRPLAEAERIVRRELPSMGFDLDALPAAVSPAGAVLRLRRRDSVVVTLDDLVNQGTLSRTMATFLAHCIGARSNVLVVGGRDSGAGELLSALAAAAQPDRVFVLQDEEEFANVSGTVMPLNLDAGVEVEALLGSIAKFPSHRLLVDGFRGQRALGTLQAICDGAEGTVACLRARSIEKGIAQLCAQVGLQGGAHDRPMAEALLACFDIAIEVARLRDGRCRVLRITELVANDGGITAEDIFDFVLERTVNGGYLEGTFRASGRTPLVAAELKAKGARIDLGMFSRT